MKRMLWLMTLLLLAMPAGATAQMTPNSRSVSPTSSTA